ncbi:hypothetical protein CMO85_03145 [Candidatus Woesearchaeota archaeon]|nr:hypothetical protein [Candidatus Woesearchaeota archaeon]
MRHHLDQHRVKRSGFVLDGPAINADHSRHAAPLQRPIVELIQAVNRCGCSKGGQGVIGDLSLFLFMSEDMILEHAASTDTDFLIYTGDFCGYCRALKNLLQRKELSYTEYNFDHHDGMRKAVVQATGHRTVPVVFDLRGEQTMFIGGFDETNRYLKKRS